MFIPFKENEPCPQQLPLFSNLKKNSFIGNIRRVYVSRVLLLVDQFWRSSSKRLLVTPKSNLKFYGNRSFQVAAPSLYKSYIFANESVF